MGEEACCRRCVKEDGCLEGDWRRNIGLGIGARCKTESGPDSIRSVVARLTSY